MSLETPIQELIADCHAQVHHLGHMDSCGDGEVDMFGALLDRFEVLTQALAALSPQERRPYAQACAGMRAALDQLLTAGAVLQACVQAEQDDLMRQGDANRAYRTAQG